MSGAGCCGAGLAPAWGMGSGVPCLRGAERVWTSWFPLGSARLSGNSISNKPRPETPGHTGSCLDTVLRVSDPPSLCSCPGVAHLPAWCRQELLSEHFRRKRVGFRKLTLPWPPLLLLTSHFLPLQHWRYNCGQHTGQVPESSGREQPGLVSGHGHPRASMSQPEASGLGTGGSCHLSRWLRRLQIGGAT